VDNKFLQLVKNFKYLGFEISYEKEKSSKKSFAQILGNQNNILNQLWCRRFQKLEYIVH
jgi:hypothetical protein